MEIENNIINKNYKLIFLLVYFKARKENQM